ncbi:MAG: Ppx/GppA family phosphatase [Pseudomonadales bacterium]|nr:Ppx/GppA family phosphatase [Pseudomonadales bacterium]
MKNQKSNSDEIYAALDLGSNSFHLLVAGFASGQLRIIDRYKENVRLAQGLKSDGRLSRKSMETALASLHKFSERLRTTPQQHIRVVGTNTLRAAKNADLFLERAEAVLGLPINIISGLEEARLIYLGVAKDFSPNMGERLVVDIGGGSTELVLGKDQPIKLESLYMGCVSFTRQYFPDGKISARRYQSALIAARLETEASTKHFHARHWQEAVGSSGTIRAIENVIFEMGLCKEHVITLDGLKALAGRVVEFEDCEKLNLPGLDPERREVFPGGLAVLHGVFLELGIKQMHVSAYAIREGIVYDLAGRFHHKDKREETVTHFMTQYRVDHEQVDRMQAFALKLLAQVEQKLETTPDQSKSLLKWAIALHEIGLSVAHSAYHKHSAYLLLHSDMPGFSRQEQKLLSFLVLNHRRKLKPMKETYGFEPDWRLVILLRLAFLFNRCRSSAGLPDKIAIAFKNGRVDLCLNRNWVEQHPLTEEALHAERQYLDGVGLKMRLLAE